MSSVTFKIDTRTTARIALAALAASAAVCVALGFAFWKSYQSISSPYEASTGHIDSPVIGTQADPAVWTTFFRRSSTGQGGRASQNYRLAGTFFEFGASHDSRKAIIDEISTGQQHIVTEGQSLADLLVLAIAADHVLVRTPSGAEEELWLSFKGGTSGSGSSAARDTGGDSGNEPPVLPDLFGGRQVGENRWVFEREKLMDYYTELMSEPERLVKVFDSFKPIWVEGGKIDGYEIEVFGEQPFFNSTGLKAGDKVRAVNSIEMSNRRRAEYLIKEFVSERVNVVVMDVERDGKPQKFIYQIR